MRLAAEVGRIGSPSRARSQPGMVFLAIDLGTESLGAAMVAVDGRQLAVARAGYATTYPHPQWAEQSPEDWWAAAGVSPGKVGAIGLDAFASTMVVADERGHRCGPPSGDGRPGG